MVIFFLYFCVGLAYGDITGQNPAPGTCLCLSFNNVNVRKSACGEVVGNHGIGSCWKYEGVKETCDLGGTIYEFFSLDYPDGGWAAGNFLITASDTQCEETGPGDCEDVEIVTRAQWGARPPRSTSTMATPVSNVFIHHTVTGHCFDQTSCSTIMRSIQNFHMDSRGWNDIAYNWLVGEDGRIYEGRGWDAVGSHTSGFNGCAVAVSFIGNFMSRPPNAESLGAARDIIACGIRQNKVTPGHNLYGHRQGGATLCPGDQLFNVIRTWPNWDGNRPSC